MSEVNYEIVQHDGGWAYKVADVFSETFPTEGKARAAAEVAAARQELPGPTETIEYQDENGEWHEETARGDDRPDAHLKD
jgi:hypothetical protein